MGHPALGHSASDVLVLGAGSTGLACAAELAARGVAATVLESEGIGAAWENRYRALRLNTSRRISELPGAPFPRHWGRFPTRGQLAGYLRHYAADRRLDVRTGITVRRIVPDPRGVGWQVDTDQGPHRAAEVIVALGIYRVPVLPGWADSEDFPGRVLHSSAYRDGTPFASEDVLVVGSGASGLEIAHDLVASGARSVRLAVRTPPNLMMRTVAGLPADAGLPLMLRLPVPVADRMAAVMRQATIGDLSGVGLPLPQAGPFAELARGKAAASIDGPTIADLRAGRITVVPAVRALGGGGVHLADGTILRVDAVVAATGFRPGLEEMAGHLGVLDGRGCPQPGDGREALPGLRFIGYAYVPGLTGWGGRRARVMARELKARTSTALEVSAR